LLKKYADDESLEHVGLARIATDHMSWQDENITGDEIT